MMKTLKLSFLLLTTLLLTLSCSDKPKTPEAIAQKFVKELYTGHFDKAKQLCAPETRSKVDLIQKVADKEGTEMLKKSEFTVTTLETTIVDKTNMRVKVQMKGKLYDFGTRKIVEDVAEDEVDLRKDDDRWVVNFQINK